MDKINKNKISIRDGIKEGFYLYKNNYKLLLCISAIGFLINLIYITANYSGNYFKNTGMSGAAGSIIFMVMIAIPNLYFSTVITITLIKSIHNISNNYKITFEEAYKYAKSRFWTYFGTSIVIGIILVISIIAEVWVFTSCKQVIIKYVVMGALLVPLIYFMVIYYFALILAAVNVECDNKGYLGTSKSLVKGDFLKIFAIALIAKGIFWIPAVYVMLVPASQHIAPLNKYIYDIVTGIITTIYDPFAQAVSIVVLNQLISSKFITKSVVDETNFTDI